MSTTAFRSRLAPALGLALLAAALMFGAKAERADAGLQFLMGDADCQGQVNSVDASIILQTTAGLLQTVPCARNAHLNSDALITSVDATILLQYVAGLVNQLTPVPVYEGAIVSLGSDACRALDVGPADYVLNDPTVGTPGQSVRIWGFLDASSSLCSSSPVLKVVAVLPLS
jgi:hypothetical protein